MNELLYNYISTSASSMEAGYFMLSLLGALLLGLCLSAIYLYRSDFSHSFMVTLALLPAVVAVIMMMVNGQLGAGVAVAGTFSLVRFRSMPGSAKEIGALFTAMGAGLICGMGYIVCAFLFVGLLGACYVLYTRFQYGAPRTSGRERRLQLSIPEDLNYTEVFADIFEKYTERCQLEQIKTSNMGSLFKLQYRLSLRREFVGEEKAMLDELRCRNGNLEICMAPFNMNHSEL